MSELRDKRALFTKLICRLVNEMIFKGYTPCFGKEGLKHMDGSLHYEGLAKDIDLYKGDQYLDKTEDHAEFGKIWESYNPLCRWGGRFKDGNHYAIEYQGKK